MSTSCHHVHHCLPCPNSRLTLRPSNMAIWAISYKWYFLGEKAPWDFRGIFMGFSSWNTFEEDGCSMKMIIPWISHPTLISTTWSPIRSHLSDPIWSHLSHHMTMSPLWRLHHEAVTVMKQASWDHHVRCASSMLLDWEPSSSPPIRCETPPFAVPDVFDVFVENFPNFFMFLFMFYVFF